MSGRLPIRIRRGLLALAAVGLLSGCDQEPQDVYYSLATAAEFGDKKAFLAGFSESSRPIIETMISLSEAYPLPKADPLKQLVFAHIEEVELKGEDEAILLVSRGQKERKILMVKTEEEGWRIDVKKLNDFWEKKGKYKNRE